MVTLAELVRESRPKTGASERALRVAAADLDQTSQGTWVAGTVAKRIAPGGSDLALVIDGVSVLAHVESLRKAFGATILHVHLTKDADRYAPGRSRAERSQPKNEFQADFKDSARALSHLAAHADVLIDSARSDPESVLARVLARVGQRPTIAPPAVDVIVGGQYGSEGKGNIAAYLAPEYDVLVRVGGPNAGHKVFQQDDDPFTFHQLPSGTKRNDMAKLVIGAGAVISLPTILREIGALDLEYDRILIDPQAMIIEQSDIDWEKDNLRDRIASTAQGVGSASARKILHRWRDSDVRLAWQVPELKPMIGDTVEYLEDAICNRKRILLEGTQGTSLSLHHGHYPHVTSRMTTSSGCIAEAGLAPRHVNRVVMVCRTYPIRVGDTDTGETSGYMSRPITLRAISKRSGLPLRELKKTERTSTTDRPRRIAEFDWTQLRRSTMLNSPTDIALTFADYLHKDNKNAYRYEQLTTSARMFVEEIEKVSGVPVALISTQFAMRNIIDRRAW